MLSQCAGWYLRAYALVCVVLNYILQIACPKPLGGGAGFRSVGQGQLPLCSRLLPLPLGVPPAPMPATLHTASFTRP